MTRTTTPRCAAGAPRATSRPRASSRSRTGTWAPTCTCIEPERGVKLAASRFVPAGRPGRTPGARHHQLHGRHAHQPRLQGVVVPGAGQRRHAHRHGPAAEVRGGPVQYHRGPLPHPHGRGAADQHPLPARCSTPSAAAALLRVHPVLPRGGGQRRSRHARHHPRAPVRQGGDGEVRQARGKLRRAGVHGGTTPRTSCSSWSCPIA